MTPAPPESDAGERAPEPIGAYLARQRKLRGISVEDLEALTHIPRRSLERLESGVFDGKPDGFVRGFVRTVSEAIGLDAEEAVARMLAEPAAERRVRHLSLRRVGLVVVGALALAAIAALLPGLLALRGEPEAAASAEGATAPQAGATTLRRDPVRALAESLGTEASPRSLPSGDGGDPDSSTGAALR